MLSSFLHLKLKLMLTPPSSSQDKLDRLCSKDVTEFYW